MSRAKTPWSEYAIRAVMLPLGVFFLFFAPWPWASHFMVKVASVIAILSGILGPHRMGTINTSIILAIVYLFAFGPMRIVAALRRDDPLGARTSGSTWHRHKGPDPRMDERRRLRFQF